MDILLILVAIVFYAASQKDYIQYLLACQPIIVTYFEYLDSF